MIKIPGLKVIDSGLEFRGLAYGRTPQYIMIHHPQWHICSDIMIHNDHLSKGWAGAGYDVLIRKNGDVCLMRPFSATGAHCKEQDMNKLALSVCFEGNYTDLDPKPSNPIDYEMNPIQFDAGVIVIKWLMKDHKIPHDNIIPHHKVATYKDCPGKFFPLLKMLAAVKKESEIMYERIGSTDIVRISPMDLKIRIADQIGKNINLPNFINGGYFWWQADGKSYPLGILVSEGKIISNRQPHGKPAGTLIVYKCGHVTVKEILDITQEKDVWFAISGCSVLPKIRMVEAGFVGAYADIGRECDRPMIGYNPTLNKIVIARRPGTNMARARETFLNLECSVGITLDGGGSTNMCVEGRRLAGTTRRINNIITW